MNKIFEFLTNIVHILTQFRIHVQHIAQAQIRKAQLLVSCTNMCHLMLTSYYSYHILTSYHISWSWIDDDDRSVNCSISACLSMNIFHITWDMNIRLPRLSSITICAWDPTTILRWDPTMSRNLCAVDAYFLIKMKQPHIASFENVLNDVWENALWRKRKHINRSYKNT